MAGFDQPGLFYYDRYAAQPSENNVELLPRMARYRFKEFLRGFNRGGFTHIYREQLLRRCNLATFSLDVDMNDLRTFDEGLCDELRAKPSIILPVMEEAAKEVADEITKPRSEDEGDIPYVQIALKSDRYPQTIRSLKSSQVSKLVTVSGIIIGASQIRSKATQIAIQCTSCGVYKANIHLKEGLEAFQLPRTCSTDQSVLLKKCPLDPYFIVPNKCTCIDFQMLKLQESPEDVPHGEMPRHLQVYAERYLTDMVTPGNKVTVTGVYSIKRSQAAKMSGRAGDKERFNTGLRPAYLKACGIKIHVDGGGFSRVGQVTLSADEEEYFRTLASQSNIYERIARSIAPSIYGSDDVKKAIACLLFGGSRKQLPDGLKRRGDINVLLLGDPGTAKSQLLKFVEKASPVGVYTSGKGSSAAGLTASVIRDPSSKGFVMEGGAMVLADGGVVCIDEFDKMREDDRVAIHEAMEQQTISIAKAGITTTLNSRCAVLAAANSVYGRWDDSKGQDNIDFMPTILSRFDMIFVLKDEHDELRDSILAKHVIGVHTNAGGVEQAGSLSEALGGMADHSRTAHLHPNNNNTDDVANLGRHLGDNDELPLNLLKKFIAYCRRTCGPRLNDPAAAKLVQHYVKMRNPAAFSVNSTASQRKSAIPITVRQLEAVVRISEALAKMELQPFATERHVEEAFRLFSVSTLQAASTGNLSGVEGFATVEEQEWMNRIEKQLKSRLAMGCQVSEHVVIQDFVRQRYAEHLVKKVLQSLLRRGDIQYRLQRKMIYRIK